MDDSDILNRSIAQSTNNDNDDATIKGQRRIY